MAEYNFPPLNQCPDLYREVAELRLSMQKRVDEIEAYEKAIKRHMIDSIPKDSAGVYGLKFKAQVTATPTIRVSEGGWPEFLTWVRQSGNFAVLQKRVNSGVLLQLWDGDEQTQGLAIPGTERAVDVGLSVTKV